MRQTHFFTVFTATTIVAMTSSLRAETVYFLVGEIPGSEFRFDSYVLPLSEPGDIEHARRLIAEGPAAGATIASARIAVGGDGINGDYRLPGQNLWSWHVTDFFDFADLTIELCDGSPTQVEEDLDFWMANTGGQICFWNYTVIDEFEIVPEPSAWMLTVVAMLVVMGTRTRKATVSFCRRHR